MRNSETAKAGNGTVISGKPTRATRLNKCLQDLNKLAGRPDPAQNTGLNGTNDTDDIVNASMMYVSHVEEGLSKVQLATQEQIMHAQYMARIGYHGVCEYCNTEIPIERIEALPYATNCIECAALNEAENGDDVSSPRGQHHEGWSHCRNQEDEPSGSLDRVRR